MKISNSRKLDAQTKKELMFDLVLKYKLAHLDNDSIAQKLYEEGIGVEKEGKLVKPYSGKYISSVIRQALKLIADERGSYGKEVAILIENDLDSLIEAWRPLALGEKQDEDGNFLPPNAKAAEIVRKCLADKSVLLGSNAPVETIVNVRVESALEGFVNTLRELLSESAWEEVLAAITRAEQLNAEFYQSQKQLAPSGDIIDATIVEDSI